MEATAAQKGLDWMKFKPRIEAVFVENEFFHYVELSPSTSSASGAVGTAAIPENRFTDAEPVETEMAANELARQLHRTAASFNTMLGKVVALITGNVITNDAG